MSIQGAQYYPQRKRGKIFLSTESFQAHFTRDLRHPTWWAPGDQSLADTEAEWLLSCNTQGVLKDEMMKKPLILLVEDSASDVRLVHEALKEAGAVVDVQVARDGVEAIEHLQQVEVGSARRPDVILLDLNLPRKNGREVLMDVKSSPNLRPIPVVVMTSSKADDDINAAYALNANCYITKPVDLEDYISIIGAIERFWFSTVTLPDQGRDSERGTQRDIATHSLHRDQPRTGSATANYFIH